MNTDSIVKALIERQAREGWTYRRMGAELGMNHTGWFHIVSGRYKPGVRFIQHALARFPELTPLLFVPANVSASHGFVTHETHEEAA